MTPDADIGEGTGARAAVVSPDLAIVAFTGQATLAWLRLLRPGFRHCFVLLRARGQWLYYDPMSHFTFASIIGNYPLPVMMRAFRAAGCRLRLIRPRTPPRRAQAWRAYTCVEAVKRVLGLQEPWVLTPWQLYRRILRRKAGGFNRLPP